MKRLIVPPCAGTTDVDHHRLTGRRIPDNRRRPLNLRVSGGRRWLLNLGFGGGHYRPMA
jgi:hypothetical protein